MPAWMHFAAWRRRHRLQGEPLNSDAAVAGKVQLQPFSLERFEQLAYAHRHEEAANELLKLLDYLGNNYGQLGRLGNAPSGDDTADERDLHFATRIASAVSALFSDPNFRLSERGFLRFIPLQRSLANIFGASSFATADHIIHLLNNSGNREHVTLSDPDLLKFCLLYSPDSSIPIQPEVFWKKNKRLAAGLFLALLSSRIVSTVPGHGKREKLLEWLPSHLGELQLDDLPLGILHDVWMHCSYAEGAGKHEIKRAINGLIRKKLVGGGLNDVVPEPTAPDAKPVALCIVEWFGSTHSVYRTHSLSLESLRSKYHVVGVSLRGESDQISRKAFDEVLVIPPTQTIFDTVRQVRKLALEKRPQFAYFLSVGMFPETIFLANLRLAPIQIAGLGHSASTFSDCMDYFLVEEDYIGDPQRFSERVVALPRESSPYRPPANAPRIAAQERPSTGPVRVGVTASLMKFNPMFLNALRRIAQDAKVRVEFCFFPLLAQGISKIYLQNIVRRFLGDAGTVYPQLPYSEYLAKLNTCQMFVNPFPFGNMNGIVDAVRLGLPGVCWTGPEVHSHIDQGLFERLGFPGWLVTRTTEEYVGATLRLVEKPDERLELSRKLQRSDPDAVLFRGNAGLFADAVEWVVKTHGTHGQERLLRPSVARKPAGHSVPQPGMKAALAQPKSGAKVKKSAKTR
jgi:hypothetical protein